MKKGNLLRRALGVLLLFGIAACVGSPAAFAKVTRAILNANLVNNNNVATIQFVLTSSGIGTRFQNNPGVITVHSPKGADRFAPGFDNGQAGTPVHVTFIGMDVVRVTLTPLKTFNAENVTFEMTVLGANTIRVSNATWQDNSSPPKVLTSRPKLPGFSITTTDADYIAFNDLTDPLGIRNLQFTPNITEADFDAVDLDTVLEESFNPSLPSFFMSPSAASPDFLGLPDPDPGNLFAAVGQILDSSGAVVGAFEDGVQTTVLEPSSLALLLLGLGSLFWIAAEPMPLMSKPRITRTSPRRRSPWAAKNEQ